MVFLSATSVMTAPASSTPASVRRKGLVRFVISFAGFAIMLSVAVFVLPYFHHELTPPGMIPFALPGAYALAGLVEIVTGISFFELARRWDELKGWQRGILGTVIALFGGALVVLVMGCIASFL